MTERSIMHRMCPKCLHLDPYQKGEMGIDPNWKCPKCSKIQAKTDLELKIELDKIRNEIAKREKAKRKNKRSPAK